MSKEATWASVESLKAGTPNMARRNRLAAAVIILEDLGMDAVLGMNRDLIAYVFPKLQAVEGLTIYGSRGLAQRSGVIAGFRPSSIA